MSELLGERLLGEQQHPLPAFADVALRHELLSTQ